jgi:hypothetical protein
MWIRLHASFSGGKSDIILDIGFFVPLAPYSLNFSSL